MGKKIKNTDVVLLKESELKNVQVVAEPNVVEKLTYNAKITISGIRDPITMQLEGKDTIMDIRNALSERQDTCFRTCICLRNEKGEKLDDCAEITSICSSADEVLVIKITDEPYTFQTLMSHIKTFYGILCSDFHHLALQGRAQLSLSLVRHITQLDIPDCATNSKKTKPKLPLNPPSYVLSSNEVPLNQFFADLNLNNSTTCIKALRLSLYNPPHNNKKLIGDLLYIEIISLEDKFLGITCRVDGFFINRSTIKTFDPRPVTENEFFCTLDLLLCQMSPLFKEAMTKIQANSLDRYILEVSQTPDQVVTWLNVNTDCSEDLFRTIDFVSSNSFFEESSPGQVRDWNEEYQSIKLLPQTDPNEQILRDRYIHKVDIDLTAASRKGALAVIDGQVSSLNDMDEDRLKMYIWNNLFICIACDSRDHFKDMGGDIAGHIASGLDMDGIRILNDFDIPNLHSLGTRVVDYGGYRLVVQTILPGIFHRDPLQTIDYGSIDHGKTIFCHPKFKSMLAELTTPIGSIPQIIKNEKDENVELVSSLEFKGIIGTDGRCYLLDLYRLLPPDPTFLADDLLTIEEDKVDIPVPFTNSRDVAKEKDFIIPSNYSHKLSTFRIEYITHLKLCDETSKLYKSIYEAETNKKVAENTVAENTVTENTVTEKTGTENTVTENTVTENTGTENTVTENTGIFKDEIPIDTDEKCPDSSLKFNSDCFDTNIKRPESESEKMKKSRNSLRIIATFLVSEYIPRLIQTLADGNYFRIIDGLALTEYLHEKGVNMRYLGYIHHLSAKNKQLTHITNISLVEMVCRVAKRMFRYCLRKCDRKEISVMASHFLNCFLGSNPTPKIFFSIPQKQGGKKIKLANLSHVYHFNWKHLSPTSFWAYLLEDVRCSFGFETSIRSIDELCTTYDLKRQAFLRNFCIKAGVQITINNYDFTSKKGAVFSPTDILNIFPVVKPAKILSRTKFGRDITGLKNIMRNPTMETVSHVHQELQHLMAYLDQVASVISIEQAECYNMLATIYWYVKDTKQAEACRLKATIMLERILGIDHYQTVAAYYQLALNIADTDNYYASIQLLYRAMYLIQLSYGSSNHPFIFEIEQKLAYYFHAMHESENSLIFCSRVASWLNDSSRLCFQQVAEGHKLAAYFYALSSQYRNAIAEEKKILNIYKLNNVSEEDQRVKEASQRYSIYVHHAVSVEKPNSTPNALKNGVDIVKESAPVQPKTKVEAK